MCCLKIKNNYQQEKARHLEEIGQLKNQLNTYSHKLNEKTSQIKALVDKSTCLEQLLKEKEDQLTKTNQELIVEHCFILFYFKYNNKYF